MAVAPAMTSAMTTKMRARADICLAPARDRPQPNGRDRRERLRPEEGGDLLPGYGEMVNDPGHRICERSHRARPFQPLWGRWGRLTTEGSSRPRHLTGSLAPLGRRRCLALGGVVQSGGNAVEDRVQGRT